MVSILIPCFNGQQYLARCINSCLNQTYKEIKIIIVNDGSTDNSEQIIKDFQKQDSRIEYYNQTNQGLSQTRNILIEKVKTNFFFFLDADDWLEKDTIEIYMHQINDNDMVINSCFINKNGKSKPFYITNKIDKNTNKYNFLINNTLFAWGILYRTKFVKENKLCFNGKYHFFEDAGSMVYWLYKANKIGFLNNPKYHYFVNTNKSSLSRSKISIEKIGSALGQLRNLYSLLKTEKENNLNKWPKYINDQLCFYHCIVFVYINFQSSFNLKEKKEFKKQLKNIEKENFRLRFPKRYWKFWFFVLYRMFLY